MIVLHAIWDSTESGRRLHIWAESSRMPGSVRGRGRSTRKPKPRLHPFAYPRDRLGKTVEALSEEISEIIKENAESDILTLILPSKKNGPLPSPGLVREENGVDKSAQKPTLMPWFMDSLTLPPEGAQEFLLSLPVRAPRGRIYGSSLQFWMEAAKFALELTARQRFVPTLHRNEVDGDTFYRAEWNVVITEADYERFRLLSSSMPPVCRAIHTDAGDEAPNGAELLTDFLNSIVDSAVRRSLREHDVSLISKKKKTRFSTAEKWLKALSGEEAEPDIAGKKAEELIKKLNGWLFRIVPVDMDTPFRTCFRLEAPEPEGTEGVEAGAGFRSGAESLSRADGKSKEPGRPQEAGSVKNWRITFHLQARDDRSLLVDAERVWQAGGSEFAFLQRRFENPQERLLEDLGRASVIFPELEECLQSSTPVELRLDVEQAYRFLRETAPLLEEKGFGVLLPAWWERTGSVPGIRLKLKSKDRLPKVSSGAFGLESILDYDWEIALGDTTLTPEEFRALAEMKQPLVGIKGKWVELRKEDVEKAIAFFEKKRMTMGEAMRLALGQERENTGLPVVGIEAEGWAKDIFRRIEGGMNLRKLRTPKGFRGTLRPYQIAGYSWLSFLSQFGFGACLADDMGLGKTIQFIALMLREKQQRRRRKAPSLIVCPMSVVENWRKEIERFAPSLKVMVHHGQKRLSGEEFIDEAAEKDIVITTYGTVLRDQGVLRAINWRAIALDEAQNIKNPLAKQTKAVKSLKADYRVALTGTPVENRLSELWSIMDFLNPGYLGRLKEFHNRFVVPIEKYRYRERARVLRGITGPFILRRLKSDPNVIRDLPEKMEMKVYCNLTSEQASLYEAVVDKMMKKIEGASGIKRKGAVLSALTALKQICNHPALYIKDGSPLPGRSGKLARLTEMLEEVLAEGDRALVFTQYAEMGMMLRHHIQETLGCETLFLHGGTGKKQRDAMINRFQNEERGPSVFILSLKAGGVGLNLTAANHVFHFDRWWNPAVENQATDRAFRIGQKKNVQVHKFITAGTLEEKIDAMIEQKMELAESIVGTGEDWLTELSTDRIREIISLSRDAVGGE